MIRGNSPHVVFGTRDLTNKAVARRAGQKDISGRYFIYCNGLEFLPAFACFSMRSLKTVDLARSTHSIVASGSFCCALAPEWPG